MLVASFPTGEGAEVCHYRLTELFGDRYEFPIGLDSRLTGSEWAVYARPIGQDLGYVIDLS